MATKSFASTLPTSCARFSDYKVNTVSTAERQSPLSSSDQSQVSQFLMTDRPIQNINQVGLTFASITYKQNLQKRISTFIRSLEHMLGFIGQKKTKRRDQIHREIFMEQAPRPKIRSKKLTFQMIGSYLKKDNAYSQLILQELRLNQVKNQVTELEKTTNKIRGGFTQWQIIDLMNTINRIQQYCEYLCRVIDYIEGDQKVDFNQFYITS